MTRGGASTHINTEPDSNMWVGNVSLTFSLARTLYVAIKASSATSQSSDVGVPDPLDKGSVTGKRETGLETWSKKSVPDSMFDAR